MHGHWNDHLLLNEDFMVTIVHVYHSWNAGLFAELWTVVRSACLIIFILSIHSTYLTYIYIYYLKEYEDTTTKRERERERARETEMFYGHTYLHTCTKIDKHIYTYIYICIYVYTYIYIYMYVCIYARFAQIPGYVWVALLSLLIAMLMYVPWRLSKDNSVPRRDGNHSGACSNGIKTLIPRYIYMITIWDKRWDNYMINKYL